MAKPFRILAALFVLVSAATLAACQFGGLTPQQDADLRAVYQRMKANDIKGVADNFDPGFKQPTLTEGLAFMQGMIPPQTPKVTLLKGVVEDGPNGATDYGGVYEYDYPSTAVLADIRMRQDKAGRKTITALRLLQQKVGIAEDFKFRLDGRKPFQWAFLFLMALSPGLAIWGLIALHRAPDIKWKPIWALAMSVGFMDLTMDWTTGDAFRTAKMIHPLWIAARHLGPLSPWMLSTSFPLAAVVFLLGYRGQRLNRPWDAQTRD
jgi:hypothetical protein